MASGLPQVGLEAIIEGMAQFQANAASIQKAYESIDQGANQVQKTTGGFSSVFSSLGSSLGAIGGQFVGLGQSVLKFGAIAGGAALVGVAALGAGIVALGASAVTEFAKYERMSLSIQNLVAREISQGQLVEKQVQTRIQLTQKEQQELAGLPQKLKDEELGRQTLAARIQEQQQKIIQLTAAYGENGLNVQVAKARLAEMENEFAKSGNEVARLQGRIQELNNDNGGLAITLQKVRVGQVSMSDAMAQAAPKAQELLKWIQILAIQSPFNQEGIASAFQTAMAYGFTTDQAKRLTNAEVDFAAATGKSVEITNQIALALGQVQAKGKVSGQEIIQLTNAGVGVNKILEDMGFTLDDVSKGLVDSDKFIEAVITDMEVFKGAAKDQSTTFAGLIASLEDLKSIGLREFFTGTFKAIQPYLINFVNFLTDAALSSGSIRALGDAIGQSVGNALATISNLVAQFQRWGPEGIFAAMGFSSSSLFIASVKSLFDLIAGQLPSAQSMFEGFSSTIAYLQANLFPMLTQAVSFVIEHFVEFKGALIGIGAVLGAGVFAALVAGLVSLLSPINLIIAAVALLGAAWAGNWGDIQGKTLAAWAVIQPVLTEIVTWLQTNIPIAIQTTSAFWTSTLQPAMVQVAGWITGTLIPTLTILWGWLSTNIPAAIQSVSTYWTGTLLPAISSVTSYISTVTIPFFTAVGNVINAIVVKASQAWAGLWQNVLTPALMAVGGYVAQTLGPIFTTFGDWLGATFGPIIQQLGGEFLPSVTNGFNGIVTAIQSATTWLNTLASNITALQLPAWLTPGSPTPFELGLLGIAAALQGPFITALTTFAGIMATTLVPIQLGWQTLIFTIDNLNLITFPTLITSLLNFSTLWIAQLLLMQQQVLLLQVATTTSAPIMSTAIMSTGPAITTVTNLVAGLSSIVTALRTVATTAANGVRQAFLSVDWRGVGQAIGNGIMDGIESKANEIKRLAEKVAEDALEAAKKKLGIHSPSQVFFEVGQEIVNGMTQGILSLSSNPVKAATSMIDKIFSALSPSEVGTQASQFAQAFATPLQGTLTNLQKNIDLNKASLTASLNFLSDKLGRTVTVQDFPELRQMLINNTIPNNPIANNIENALDAQNELNAAMEEQARMQGQLSTLQTQQQQFTFLQKQIELVDFLTKQGLNAAQVLKGIPLGVGANASNLLAAMQATIEASIAKMNQQLAGIPTGAAAAVNAPVAQTPTVSAVGNTNSTNYNFQMTVNSGASAESVIQQFNIARAMLT